MEGSVLGIWYSIAVFTFRHRHQIGFRRFHQHMIVIAHQHVGVDTPSGLAAGLAERFEKAKAVPVIPIDPPALVAPGHHMMNGPAIFNAQRAWP